MKVRLPFAGYRVGSPSQFGNGHEYRRRIVFVDLKRGTLRAAADPHEVIHSLQQPQQPIRAFPQPRGKLAKVYWIRETVFEPETRHSFDIDHVTGYRSRAVELPPDRGIAMRKLNAFRIVRCFEVIGQVAYSRPVR